ncbi:MAG: DUF922 domain-containing protein [Sphingomonas sp.]|nr:DUF922 domain-containing protein [Sphingomonas sp.]
MSLTLLPLVALAMAPIAAGQEVTAERPPSVPAGSRSLEALPNATVVHYNVTGANLTAVNASVAANSPKDPSTKAPSPSSSEWGIAVRFEQKAIDGKCAVAAAQANFSASVVLPRLSNREGLKPDERKVWDQYVANLKSAAAAELWFVHDRVGRIEEAILASSCTSAGKAASAAAERLQQELARFASQNRRQPPTFRVPVRDVSDPRS